MRGRYTLVNKNDRPVDTVHLLFFRARLVTVDKLDVQRAGGARGRTTYAIGLRSYKLASPLAPGGATHAGLRPRRRAHTASRTRGAFTDVEYNGSFVNGMIAAAVHRLPAARRAHGRPRTQEIRARRPASGCATATIPQALAENDLSPDADFITFEATVGTEDDQFAIAPGYLQERMDRGWPPVFRVPDGQPDPQFLRVPVGPIRA